MWPAPAKLAAKSYVYENKLNFHSYEEGPQDDSRIYKAALQRSFLFTRRMLGYADAVFVLTIGSKHGMAAIKVFRCPLDTV